MPGGGRRTHLFPTGMPPLLLIVEVVFPLAIFILLVALVNVGFNSWRRGALVVAAVATFLCVRAQLVRYYERRGRAIRLR